MSNTRFRGRRHRGWRRSRLVMFALTVSACVVLVAVGVTVLALGRSWPFDSRQSVRGVIVQVEGASIVFAESVTLRGADGMTQTFRVDPEVATNREEPQSASHLRQHMVLGDPVIIRYRLTDDGPVALRIVDAD